MTFVDDSTGTLGADAIGRINATTSSLDVKVVVASTGSRGDLDQMVGYLMNSANTLAIGVDPVHHYTFTHFGTGTGINSGDYRTVAHAGDGEFHAGHFEQGIEAIVAAANAASVRTASHSSVTVQQPVTVVEHPVSAWPFVLGFAALAIGVLLAARWSKRRAADQAKVLDGFREEAAQMRSRNVEEQGWHDKYKSAGSRSSAKPAPTGDGVPVRLDHPNTIPQPAPGPSTAPAPTPRRPARSPEELDREAYLRSRRLYPAPAASSAPVIYQQNQGSGNDLALGMLLGNAMAPRAETVVVRERINTPAPRHRSITPVASASSSSSDWGSSSSSSSYDSGSSGGGYDSGGSSGGSDGGSSGGDF